MKTLSMFVLLSLLCPWVDTRAAEPIRVTLRLRSAAESFPVTQITETSLVVRQGDGTLKSVGFSQLLPEDRAKVLPEMKRLQAERQAREAAALPPPPPVKPTETEAQMQERLAEQRARSGTLRTLDGVQYTEVFLRSVEADSVTILHAGGIAHIELHLLPKGVLASLRKEVAARQDTAKVIEQQAEKMRGDAEWARAQRNPKALTAHSLSGRVMEQTGDGILIARLTFRPDITDGLYGFVEGVTGRAPGEPFTGKVKRAGVWTAIDGRTYPKYVISR